MIKVFKGLLIITILLTLALVYFYSTTSPSNDRGWWPEHSLNASFIINNGNVTINNLRSATYNSGAQIDRLNYYSKTFNINDLETLDYFVTPFGTKGVAHAILSFGFGPADDREYLALSIEARKEINESYDLLAGMMDQYEIIYIWADESDVIRTRVENRGEDTYRYHLNNLDQANLQKLFMQFVIRTNELANSAEFYHTIWNNCTIDLWRQVNTALPDRLPWTWAAIFPEKSGEYLIDQDLMMSDESTKTHKERRVPWIGDKALDYSASIRS